MGITILVRGHLYIETAPWQLPMKINLLLTHSSLDHNYWYPASDNFRKIFFMVLETEAGINVRKLCDIGLKCPLNHRFKDQRSVEIWIFNMRYLYSHLYYVTNSDYRFTWNQSFWCNTPFIHAAPQISYKLNNVLMSRWFYFQHINISLINGLNFIWYAKIFTNEYHGCACGVWAPMPVCIKPLLWPRLTDMPIP